MPTRPVEEKALLPMDSSLLWHVKYTVFNWLHEENAELSIDMTESGIVIDVKPDELKTEPPNCVSELAWPNIIVLNEVVEKNAADWIVTTLSGTEKFSVKNFEMRKDQ